MKAERITLRVLLYGTLLMGLLLIFHDGGRNPASTGPGYITLAVSLAGLACSASRD